MVMKKDIMSDNTILKGKKILITGGAGFIGSNLCESLLNQGNNITCLDNLSTGFLKNIEHLIEKDNFKFIEGDIRNYDDCLSAVDGVDIVLHQAALGSVPRSIKDPITSIDVNIGGFARILFAAKEAGVKRFVYAASSSTYGDSKNLPKVEHIIGNPLSPYAITKYTDEQIARNFSDIYGIETIGLRYFNVFGRRQDPNGAYAAVIPKWVNQLINHKQPVINGNGSYSRDFTYIDNVIQANQLAASVPFKDIVKLSENNNIVQDSNNSSVFNIAYGGNTTLNQLIEILKNNLSQFDNYIADIEPIYGDIRAGDIPHSCASIDKAKLLLGYDPEFDVNRGLSECCKWYYDNLK